MRSGTKAGLGAALQTIGQGLMQVTQVNIEEMRQRNLEAIRQRERGEDRAERQTDRETQQANWDKNFGMQQENANTQKEQFKQSMDEQRRGRQESLSAAAAARADAKEARAFEAFERVDNLYQGRLEAIEKAEREQTVTPEIAQQQRIQIAKESSSKKAELVRRYPFLKGYTVDDYLTPPAGEAAPAAAPAPGAPATEGKKPMPAGLMAPKSEPDAVSRAIDAEGLQPTESLGTIVKEGVASAGRTVGTAANAVSEGWSDSNAGAQVAYVMNRLEKTGTVPQDAIQEIAASSLTESQLRQRGANDKVIALVQRIRSTQ